MSIDIELVSKAVISLLVITSPFDAVKILFFNHAITAPPRGRTLSAAKVAILIFVVLSGTALIGLQVLDLLGIDLDVFGAVGGIMIGLIGVGMLSGKGTGRQERNKADEDSPEKEDALMIPLTMPLIVGPGAIATTIAISSQGQAHAGALAATIGALIAGLAAFVSYAWLGDILAKARPATVTVITRIGGLLLLMIGAQMFLSSLRHFFA